MTGGVVAEALPVPRPPRRSIAFAVEQRGAACCGSGKNVLILLGGASLGDEGRPWPGAIAQATGAQLMADYVNARVARGRGRLQLERVPYSAGPGDRGAGRVRAHRPGECEARRSASSPIRASPRRTIPPTRAGARAGALRAGRPPRRCRRWSTSWLRRRPPFPIRARGRRRARGAPTPEGLAQTVAALMPENAIVSDESVSFGRGFYRAHACRAGRMTGCT